MMEVEEQRGVSTHGSAEEQSSGWTAKDVWEENCQGKHYVFLNWDRSASDLTANVPDLRKHMTV